MTTFISVAIWTVLAVIAAAILVVVSARVRRRNSWKSATFSGRQQIKAEARRLAMRSLARAAETRRTRRAAARDVARDIARHV